MMFEKVFKKKASPVVKKPQLKQRRFVGAANSAFSKFNSSFMKINGQLRSDYIALTLRARDLAKNNQTVSSWINLMMRSVLGNTGFILNATAYNEDGTSDVIANSIIEKAWGDYVKNYRKYVSADGQLDGLEFDRHLLFNYLVDGQAFIRKIKDPKSPYGIRFEVLDALQVDPLYNAEFTNGKEKIVMGIKVDEHYKPLSYFIRKNSSADYYLTGDRVEVPASEIIHLYQKKFAQQVRGYTPLAPVLIDLNLLEQYKTAEVSASLLNSLWMGVWQKQSASADAFNDFDDSEIDEQGDVAIQLENNVIRYSPDGYKLTQISSNHPNSNVGAFLKSILKGVAGCLGLSYNKMTSDYEAVNFSSLRASAIEDEVTVKEIQQFLISNWKNVQYAEWLKYFLISDLSNLPYSKIDKFLEHEFRGRNFVYVEPTKELQAVQMRLQMGLSNPIDEIRNLGKNPETILAGWVKWNEMLQDRGLKISSSMELIENAVDETEKENEE